MAAEELSELAAERRDRYVAHVKAPAPLSAEQERRLAETLTRMYGRPMSVQVEVDPDLLGGLVVRVGNEVIDGSVAGRMATARRELPKCTHDETCSGRGRPASIAARVAREERKRFGPDHQNGRDETWQS